MNAAIRVAAPKKTGNIPVASGSRLPACPAFSAANRRLARCNARFEDMPEGLSSNRSPNTSRLGRGASVTKVPSVGVAAGAARVVDELADLDGATRGRVVPKPQVGDSAQLQSLADARTEKTARLLEPFLDRHGIVLETERVEVHGREAQIAGDLDLADASGGQPWVLDLREQ